VSIPGPGTGTGELYRGLRKGGVDFVVHIPDSVLSGVSACFEADGDVPTLVCAREDEGIAIAAGAYLAGRVPVAIMEGSGVGYSALILARAQIQRTPVLLLVGHSPALGERFDFHGATRMASAGVLTGLGIPHVLVDSNEKAALYAEQAVITMTGQKTCIALVVPPYLTART
jgi:sulfopyruvate decarboxylase TPP-binding subunit